MPQDHILVERQVGREVEAATEPPHIPGAEEAHIQMTGWNAGAARVHDHRQTHRPEAASGELWVACGRGWWQLRTTDIGEGDPGTLEQRAAFQYRGHAASGKSRILPAALPRILKELTLRLFGLKSPTQLRLQRHQAMLHDLRALLAFCHRRHEPMRTPAASNRWSLCAGRSIGSAPPIE